MNPWHKSEYSLLSLNARSLCYKMPLLQTIVDTANPSIILITESWGHSGIQDAVFSLPHYTMFRCDREKDLGPGGGVLLYVHDSFPAVQLSHVYNFKESVWCHLQMGVENVVVGCIYRPPSSDAENDASLAELIAHICSQHKGLVIISGDFNLPRIDWEHLCWPANCDWFMDAIENNYLHQHILQPTRQSNILDLLFSNDPSIVSRIELTPPLGSSDHASIICYFQLVNSREVTGRGEMFRRDYRNADWASYRRHLEETDWDAVFHCKDTDDLWDAFAAAINRALSDAVPKKMSKQRNRHRKRPWQTRELLHAVRGNRSAWRRFQAAPTPQNDLFRKEASKRLCNITKSAVQQCEQAIATNITGNSKGFWSYVRSKTRVRDAVAPLKDLITEEITADPFNCAKILSDFFASVFVKGQTAGNTNHRSFPLKTHSIIESVLFDVASVQKALSRVSVYSSPGPDEIPYVVLKEGGILLFEKLAMLFQISLRNGSVPAAWREAIITPIFKKGSRNEAKNYRPVSLTSCVCKVMEAIIRDALMTYMESENLLLKSQYGFRPGYSCSLQLLEYFDFITQALDEGDNVHSVYLDCQKAFDSVPHSHLLAKLSAYGIKGHLHNWLKSFLSNRYQTVRVRTNMSPRQEVLSGVVQGSVIGPLLFLIYVNDIDDFIIGANLLKFADDLKLFCRVPRHGPKVVEACNKLQQNLDALEQWQDSSGLIFNPAKSSWLCFGTPTEVPVAYKLNLEQIPQKCQEKDLGIVVSNDAKFSLAVSEMASKAQSMLSLLVRTFHSRAPSVLVPIYKALVRPYLEYCSPLWNPYLKRDRNRIESVQRRFTKLFPVLRQLPYDQRLTALNLETLEIRRIRSDLLLTYNMVSGNSPVSWEHYFELSTGVTRAQHDWKWRKPGHRLDCRKKFFSHRVIDSWNNLPASVISSCSSVEFKHKLKKCTDTGYILVHEF